MKLSLFVFVHHKVKLKEFTAVKTKRGKNRILLNRDKRSSRYTEIHAC